MITRLRTAVPLAAASGVAVAGAFEPVGLVALIPIGVAGLVLATRELPARWAWLPGLAFGCGFSFTLQWWMRAVGWDAYLALAALEAAFYALAGAAVPLLARLRAWPVWVALALVAVETWRSGWPFSGMPWGRFAYATADTPYAAALPWVGTAGVSLLLALGGTLLAWLVTAVGRPRLAAAAVTAYAAVVALPVLLPYEVATDGSAVVAPVQGNVPGDGSDILLDHRQVTRNHADATVRLAADVAAGRVPRPDFVLWPENATAVDPFRDPGINAEIQRAVSAIGVPILVGAMVDDEDPRYVLNQGIVWDPVTGGGDRYTKWHPVPFGEYIPWRSVFNGTFGKLQLIARDMLGGSRTEPLRVDGTLVGDAICFDVAYDDGIHAQVTDGAQLLVVQTSNAMFIHTNQIEQQFEITRLRAVETGRSVAVASTNGLTGIIAPDGTVVAEARPRTQTVLVERVPLSSALTPAVRLGPWPGRASEALAVLGVLLGLAAGRGVRRTRPVPDSPRTGDEAVAVPAARASDGGGP